MVDQASFATDLPATLGTTLAEAAQRRGDALYLRHGNHATSYAALDAQAWRLAQGLRALGLGPGDRIGLLALNQIEWVQLFFAATRIGAVVVGMSLRYRDSELQYMVADSEVQAVVLLPQHEGHDFAAMFDRLSPQLPSLQCLVTLPAPDGTPVPVSPGPLRRVPFASLMEGTADDAAQAALQAFAAEVQPQDLAMVIYTSGTTGRPKGAGLTHASLLASARAQAAHMRLCSDDRLAVPLPLNHVGGITCGLLAMLTGGGTVDLIPEFKAAEVLARLRLHKPTLLGGVPTMMTLLLMHSTPEDTDLSAVRIVYAGGSNVEEALLAQLEARMPQATLMNLYGLSETSGAMVMTPWDATRQDRMTTLGQVLPGGEVRVVDRDTRQPLPAGQVGELCFRGIGVVPGYVGAAAKATPGRPKLPCPPRGAGRAQPGPGGADTRDSFSDDGWLASGDLGLVDARGVITLKGRAKDMYIQGGFNVYPAEVENHLARHPAVLMAAGIGVPDAVLGEVGRCYIVLRPGQQATADELRAWCREGLADYKVPRQFVFRTELPLTPAGKIQKAALRSEG